MKKKRTRILTLEKDDPEKESEFEIKFMLSLTAAERYRMLRRLVRSGKKLKGKNDGKKTPALVTRT